ncbi:MAG: PilZ domain-containing protein [Magnetococcales bacterium]|nr:PilZ domain-containing protein [Magnetococcales bacterium]
MEPEAKGGPGAATSPNEEVIRREERFQYTTQLSYRGDNGVTCHGHTRDVSLSGAFLFSDDPPEGVVPGDTGVAAVVVRERDREMNMAFPCTVARVTTQGLGLTFDEVEAEV